MELISVIVPVFNTEKYLDKMIKSLTDQTYSNIEIILVNDGSTDGSLEICQKFSGRDARVRVLSQENKGPSCARNYGVSRARGKYLAFVDSDDYVSGDFIECLYQLLSFSRSDISVCGYEMVYKDKRVKISEGEGRVVYSREEALRNMFRKNNIGINPCNKLFKKELFDNVRYPEGKFFEDVNTTYKLIEQAGTVAYMPEVKYYYVQHAGSTNGKNFRGEQFDHHLYDLIDAADEVYRHIERSYPELLDDISIGCIGYYLRAANQMILWRRRDPELIASAKKKIRKHAGIILKTDQIGFIRRLMFLAFGYCYWLYDGLISAYMRIERRRRRRKQDKG